MTSISLPGASGSCFVKSVFTCWACAAVANPKVKVNTDRMSFFVLCIASVLSVICCDNRKVRLRLTSNFHSGSFHCVSDGEDQNQKKILLSTPMSISQLCFSHEIHPPPPQP